MSQHPRSLFSILQPIQDDEADQSQGQGIARHLTISFWNTTATGAHLDSYADLGS
jgi:hypothetical protein